MSEKTNTSSAPYYDDYNEEKKFQKILFRPRTVQTRELIQMQTMIQKQIERMGDHLFQEGSVVIPGSFDYATYDVSIGFDFTSGSTWDDIKDRTDLLVRSTGSGARFSAEFLVESTDTQNYTAMGSIYDAAGNAIRDTFLAGEDVLFVTVDDLGVETTVAFATTTEAGQGMVATVQHGVYYVRGYFVEVDEQVHIVDRASPPSNIRIGFNVVESIVTSDDDSSLLSNAAGEPNALAPGADRLKIELLLTSKLPTADMTDFIEMVRIENGVRKTPIITTQYSLLGDTLAQRTFEESGNYTVSRHEIDLREHLNNGANNGVFGQDDGGDSNKFAALMGEGVSYVRGYRVANEAGRVLELDKGRDTAVANNAVLGAIYGGYLSIKADGALGTPSIDPLASWRFVDSSNDEIGFFNLLSMDKPSDWRLYVRNLRFNSGKTINDVVKVRCELGGTYVFQADVAIKGVVDSSTQSLLFKLPVQGVSTIATGGAADTTYEIMRDYVISTDGSGNAVISAGSNQIFSPRTTAFYLSDLNGLGGEIPATFTLGGTPTGSTLTIAAPTAANSQLRLAAVVIKTQPQPRTKTLLEAQEQVTIGSNGNPARSAPLSNTDIYRLISVTDTGTGDDVTSEFSLDNGQRDSFYNFGAVRTTTDYEGRILEVVYEYFRHGAGDYFSVDSYADIQYEDIPTFVDSQGETYRLTDTMDFRRSLKNNVVDLGDLVAPNSTVRADIGYYLSRVDTIVANSNGHLEVYKGNPAIDPIRPSLPDNVMRLYDLHIPAYTFNVEDIKYFEQENKRYTMRDIGNLEKRIDRVEETTSLNSLEQSALNTQVIDPETGLDRFKNGIFADPMVDNRILDLYDAETSCAFRDGQDFLFPRDITNGIDFDYASGAYMEDDMVMAPYTTREAVSQPYATNWINVNPYASYSWNGTMKLEPSKDVWWDVKYAPPRIFNETIDNTGGARAGTTVSAWSRSNSIGGWWQGGGRVQSRVITTTTITSQTTQRTGATNVINEEVIPYMRNVNINFTAEGMRPNTRVYGWFNGTNVSADCTQEGKFRGQPMITDEYGRISGTFFLTQRDGQRFATGLGSFELLDDEETSRDANARTTYTQAPFESAGTLVTKQTDIIRTRILGATTRSQVEYRRYDPVAQSFAVDTIGGSFLSYVEVYFRTKSSRIPVTCELRAMENGLPTHDVIARKTIYPTDVNVSTDATVATRFTFDHPQFLEQDREYCFVILANTQEYLIYYGELGRDILGAGGARLIKQPNTGVMFVSANGSTWTPRQDSDLTFRLGICDFNNFNGYAYFTPKSDVIALPLENNAITTTSGSDIVTVFQPNHGLRIGDSITIAGSVGANGVTSAALNGDHTVAGVTNSSFFTIQVSDTATSSGVVPNTTATIVGRYLFNQLFTSITQTVLSGANVSWQVRFLRDDRSTSDWIDINANEDYDLPELGNYRSTGNFELRANLECTASLSPMVDLHGLTAILNSYYVDLDDANFRYVTRDMMFSSPSESLNLYVGALLPSGSNMKVYAKIITGDVDSADIEWSELTPHVPITNDSNVVNEYRYTLDSAVLFNGVKVKVELTGDKIAVPLLRDLRGIVVT
ncbi:PEROXIDASE_4 domain-containing protein [Vibrio phage vB_VcorM_GR28A]|nr:PEROXIDASE_4 domain-containing protein [Vibrio phage vB_VcorM_GR28A]